MPVWLEAEEFFRDFAANAKAGFVEAAHDVADGVIWVSVFSSPLLEGGLFLIKPMLDVVGFGGVDDDFHEGLLVAVVITSCFEWLYGLLRTFVRNCKNFLRTKMHNISDRLIEGRKALGLSQQALADRVGIALRSQQNYEKGDRSPDANYLAALAAAGVDVLYLLTGVPEGKAQAVSAPGQMLLDRARFTAAMVAVEEGLSETRRTLPPKKKIELYLAAYELLEQSGQSRDNVIKLVRLAA